MSLLILIYIIVIQNKMFLCSHWLHKYRSFKLVHKVSSKSGNCHPFLSCGMIPLGLGHIYDLNMYVTSVCHYIFFNLRNYPWSVNPWSLSKQKWPVLPPWQHSLWLVHTSVCTLILHAEVLLTNIPCSSCCSDLFLVEKDSFLHRLPADGTFIEAIPTKLTCTMSTQENHVF